MEIRKWTGSKRDFMELLLLADEQPEMIETYLDRGEMYVLFEKEPVAVAVVTREDAEQDYGKAAAGRGICELKNIAVSPEKKRCGYGRELVAWLCKTYRPVCHTMYVGTGDSPLTVPFYKSCGFTESHRVKDFFTDHYDHPIIEAGVLLKDMVYLKKTL